MTEDTIHYNFPRVRWKITRQGEAFWHKLHISEEASKDPEIMDPIFKSRLFVISELQDSPMVTEGILRYFEPSTFVRLVPQVIEFLVSHGYIEEDDG